MEKVTLIPSFDALALIGRSQSGKVQMLQPLSFDERTNRFRPVGGFVFGSGFPEDYGKLDGNVHTAKVFGGPVAVSMATPQNEKNKKKRSGAKVVFYNYIPDATKEIGEWSRTLTSENAIASVKSLAKQEKKTKKAKVDNVAFE